MTPLEAMQRLIEVAKTYTENHVGAELGAGLTPDEIEAEEQINRAIMLIQKMLDTALPIARFRCFVSVDSNTRLRGPITDEYTICSPTIAGVRAGLISLSSLRTDVQITLWEQRVANADMISGFQGRSKTARYKAWLLSIEAFDASVVPTVN